MKLKNLSCCLLTLLFVISPVYVKAETGNDVYDLFSQYSGYVSACCDIDIDNDGLNDVVILNTNNNDYNYDCYKLINESYKKIGSVYSDYEIYESDNGIIICTSGSGMAYFINYYIQDNKLVKGDTIASYEGDYLYYNNYTVNGENVSETEYDNKINGIYSSPLDFQNYRISNYNNYYDAYNEIINEYIKCDDVIYNTCENLDWDAFEDLSNKCSDVSFEYFNGQHEDEDLCYCLTDINNDSIPELLVASIVNIDDEFYNKYWMWGIYTFKDGIIGSYESGMGNRWHCYLLTNNEIFMDSSGGATINSYSTCRLNGLVYERTSLLNWFDEDIRYNGKIISEKEAENIINEKTSAINDLKWNSVYNFNNIQIKPEIKVILNGEELSFDEQPYIENGTTRVPMRKIFESLGAIVDYDANTKTITATKDGTVIELVTGSTTAKINGRPMTLVVDVSNKNGSTMVPLRFVSEALGAEVIWDNENKVITINLKDSSELAKMIFESTDTSLSFKNGEDFIIGIGLDGRAITNEDISKLTLEIDDRSKVLSLDSKIIGNVKYFYMRANDEGVTYLYANNPKTGERVELEISINDNKTYDISNPPKQTIDNMEANIHNFSGITIDGYKFEKLNDGSCNVTFNAYNRRYVYGVVEVYNADDKLITFIPIDKNKDNATDLKGALIDNIKSLYEDVTKGAMLTYKQQSGYSKATENISFNVPKGGYFKITNDVKQSGLVATLNGFDVGLQIKSLTGEIKGADFTNDSVVGKIDTKKFVEMYESKAYENMDDLGKNTFETLIKDFTFSADGLSSFSQDIDKFISENHLNSLFNQCLVDPALGVGEDVFIENAGPAGVGLKAIFSMTKSENLVMQIFDICKGSDSGVIIFKN